MIPFPSGVRVWLAVGRTDMRRGMNGLALQVQEALGRDPHAGDLYVFRGARGDLIKILWYDGLGMSLYAHLTIADGRRSWDLGLAGPQKDDFDVLPCDASWLFEPTTGVHQFGGGKG